LSLEQQRPDLWKKSRTEPLTEEKKAKPEKRTRKKQPPRQICKRNRPWVDRRVFSTRVEEENGCIFGQNCNVGCKLVFYKLPTWRVREEKDLISGKTGGKKKPGEAGSRSAHKHIQQSERRDPMCRCGPTPRRKPDEVNCSRKYGKYARQCHEGMSAIERLPQGGAYGSARERRCANRRGSRAGCTRKEKSVCF